MLIFFAAVVLWEFDIFRAFKVIMLNLENDILKRPEEGGSPSWLHCFL